MASTPAELVAASTCLECGLNEKQTWAAILYVLAIANGMSTTPSDLANLSSCINCSLSEKQILAAILAVLDGGSGGGGGGGGSVGVVDPNGAVTGSPGDLYFNSANQTFWVKASGTSTDTGWIQLI